MTASGKQEGTTRGWGLSKRESRDRFESIDLEASAMKGVHHTGITVSNLERSIDFYHGVLGLEFDNEPSPIFDDEDLGQKVGVPGAALKQVTLRVGDARVELLEYAAPESPNDAPLPQNALGAEHVGFLVDDIEAEVRALEARGIQFFAPITYGDEGVWPAGAGSTSPIPMASRWSWWRSVTRDLTSDSGGSRPIWPTVRRATRQ